MCQEIYVEDLITTKANFARVSKSHHGLNGTAREVRECGKNLPLVEPAPIELVTPVFHNAVLK